MAAQWLEDAKRHSPEAVAHRLGLQVKARGRLTMSCPACGESSRGKEDRRLPVSSSSAGHWRCWRSGCDGRGDIVDLVAYVVAGGRYTGQPAVREWWTGGDVVHLPPPAAAPRVPEPPRYPPRAEVEALLRCSLRLTHPDARPARDWLQDRLGRLPVLAARYLAADQRLPRWARRERRSWVDLGYRLIVPTWDADGQVRSVRARRVVEGLSGPKALPPSGYSAGGLVLASPRAVLMLRGEAQPEAVVISEGEPAWAAWSSAKPRAAVVGVGSGWWTQGHADRVPDGADVILATDHDKAGDRYAEQVRETLAGRCKITRWGTP